MGQKLDHHTFGWSLTRAGWRLCIHPCPTWSTMSSSHSFLGNCNFAAVQTSFQYHQTMASFWIAYGDWDWVALYCGGSPLFSRVSSSWWSLGRKSLTQPLLCEVPRNSLLSPFLFNTYVRLLDAIICHHGVRYCQPFQVDQTGNGPDELILHHLIIRLY